MSDKGKEAKLAAARKRAEALKAKKREAEKPHDTISDTIENPAEQQKSVVDDSTATPEALSSTTVVDANPGEEDTEDRVESVITDQVTTTSSAVAPTNGAPVLEAEEKILQESPKASEQVNLEAVDKLFVPTSTEVDISKPTDEIPIQTAGMDDTKAKVKGKDNSQLIAEQENQPKDQMRKERDDLAHKLADLERRMSLQAGEHQSRLRDLQAQTSGLQQENSSLVEHLRAARHRIKSLEDEKLALQEIVNEQRSGRSKASYQSSLDTARPKVSKEFDHDTTLEEIAFDDLARDPEDPPAALKTNILIDLIFWYDKHAGEVIEV